MEDLSSEGKAAVLKKLVQDSMNQTAYASKILRDAGTLAEELSVIRENLVDIMQRIDPFLRSTD